MHERNIFAASKPDFESLALEFKEFAPYVQKGKSGKAYVNFKDPASLRSLSTVLLKKYFDLTIEIPLDKLIPTIPLRLNYIHWVEDLFMNAGYKDKFGIDIGCGASCVYPLLGCKLNSWKFIATEINEEATQYAVENIKRNDMEKFVTVLKVSQDDSPFSFASSDNDGIMYDFCMCNPPFFSEDGDGGKDRTDHRPPPASISTASEPERCTKGGEIEFVKKIIDNSISLKGRIKWYTTMIGKKSSLKPLIKYLSSNSITVYETSTFQQGRTMRWGIAWSFTESSTKRKTPVETKKALKPFITLPSDLFYVQNGITIVASPSDHQGVSTAMLDLVKFISNEFTKLNILFDEPAPITLQSIVAYEITGKAYVNTWTHQRRKRRETARVDIKSHSKSGDESLGESPPPSETDIPSEVSGTNKRKLQSVGDGQHDSEYSSEKRLRVDNGNNLDIDEEADDQNNPENCHEKRFHADNGNILDSKEGGDQHDLKKCSEKQLHDDCGNNSDSKEKDEYSCEMDNSLDIDKKRLFEFSCSIGRTSQFNLDCSDCIVLSFLCLAGNRDQFHQLFLYFKNVVQGTQLKVNYNKI